MGVGVLFPGYGSQFVGMGKDFYDRYRIVQELFEEASCCTDLNFVKLCFASSENTLGRIEYAYSALFLVQASLFRVMCHHGLQPTAVAGCGIGSMSAWYASGVITLPDGLYLLRKLTLFYQELLASKQFAIVRITPIDRQELDSILRTYGHLVVVATVTQTEYVVAGPQSSVDALGKELHDRALCIQHMPVGYGFYSHMLDDVYRLVSAYLGKIDCKAPKIRIVRQDGLAIEVGQALDKQVLTDFVCTPIDLPRMFAELGTCSEIVHIGHGYSPELGRTNCSPMLVSSLVRVTDLRASVTGACSRKGSFYGCGY